MGCTGKSAEVSLEGTRLDLKQGTRCHTKELESLLGLHLPRLSWPDDNGVERSF